MTAEELVNGLEAIERARVEYSALLSAAQSLSEPEFSEAIARLRELARSTNKSLGAVALELGIDPAIDTESLLMLEMTRKATNA